MAVFRVERNKGYTVMSNHHLRNRELSLKAKGLLSQMLSLPEDWDYTLKGLSLINREKIDAIREAIQELLQEFLQKAGYIVETACDGVEAISMFTEFAYDLILLDIMLPKINGYNVCELIRKQSQVPIIMLTALGSEEEQIRGLDLQADDYITKPFSVPILLRKIAAVFRRTKSNDNDKHFIRYKDLSLDLDGYKTYIGTVEISLTQREFEVLRELLTYQGKVLTRQNLLNKLWKYDFLGDERVVDTHIKNLRKKLNVDYIETIRGVGYKIEKDDK